MGNFLQLFLVGLILLLGAARLLFFIKQLNAVLKAALKERQLDTNFEEFYTSKTFDGVLKNTRTLFDLFNSFDSMKSSRITIESNSLSALMETLPEGIVIVNKEKVITHVNPACKEVLGLNTEDAVGQLIFRKVAYPGLLEALDGVTTGDQKTISKPFATLSAIRNKSGDVARIIIIFPKK